MQTKIKIDDENQVWLSFCGDITEIIIVLTIDELNNLQDQIFELLMEVNKIEL